MVTLPAGLITLYCFVSCSRIFPPQLRDITIASEGLLQNSSHYTLYYKSFLYNFRQLGHNQCNQNDNTMSCFYRVNFASPSLEDNSDIIIICLAL
jgi:hypothetical protein